MKKLPCNILSVDGAALAFIAVINTKKKGQERGTKSFHRWNKHKRRILKVSRRFPGQRKDCQKMKISWKTSNLLPMFPGIFQLESLMRRAQNLIFMGPALMNDLGNQFKAVFARKKLA